MQRYGLPLAWRRTGPVLLTLALAATSALAQTPPAEPSAAAPQQRQQPQRGWSDQQKAQAYATEKLAASPRRHEWVTITNGSRQLKGFVTYAPGKAKAPVVLVVHEVFGLTDSTRNTADEIAAMGYTTIAVDMLSGHGPGGGDSPSFDAGHSASDMSTSLPDQATNSDFDAWSAYANKLPESNGKLAIVGLSWGGGAAFRYVAEVRNPSLKALCVFYDVGPPPETQKVPNPGVISLTSITVPVYGFYGATDTRVIKSLPATTEAMKAAGKFYEPVVYEGADHAFMRVGETPSDRNPANPPAVKAALARLEKILKGL
jgi:carboxymethylenebutenolidase